MIGEINKHVYYKPNMLTLYNSHFDYSFCRISIMYKVRMFV